jgi:hypothetical protein
MNLKRLRWRYWRDIFRRRDLEREMDEELRAHIALETQQRIDQGESPSEARTSVLRELGSLDRVKEASRMRGAGNGPIGWYRTFDSHAVNFEEIRVSR